MGIMGCRRKLNWSLNQPQKGEWTWRRRAKYFKKVFGVCRREMEVGLDITVYICEYLCEPLTSARGCRRDSDPMLSRPPHPHTTLAQMTNLARDRAAVAAKSVAVVAILARLSE